MKTCIPCGGRPSYPLFNLCRFCLQEKMDRAMMGLSLRPISMYEAAIADPGAREPIGTNQPKPDFWGRP